MADAREPLVCPVCGTPPVPGARFCHACGALLDSSLTDATSADRRIVTVLFGDLSDFTAWAEDLDPERVGVMTDRVLAALSEATIDVGGRVDKLTGDGVMAVFGAPTAHEDDAERAVRAAARMQADVRRLMAAEAGGGRRMGLRVGINTGEVLAGVQAHLAYTVVGDTVNTASRLSDAASVGSVYAGRDTALATMSIASWRSLPPLRLKGKREPVPAYELVGLRPPGAARLGLGDEAPFIGRDAEFGHLVGKLLDVVEGNRPQSIVVTGEAGVGKTRLALEVTRFAGELPSVRVLWGRCTPYGEGRELAPFAEWMRTVFGLSESDDASTAQAKARRALTRLSQPERPLSGSVADRILALLGVVDSGPPAPRDAAAPGTIGIPRDPVVDAVAAVLVALVAHGPLVLVIDDAQWASRPLLSALGRLSHELTGSVLLLAVGRSDVLGHDWWERVPSLEVLPVSPLDEGASGRLLRAYLGGAELDPRIHATLLERAQGNPFFLAEMLHLLVDRGVLVRVGDSWQLAGELPRELLPAGVHAVLAARIDSLDPSARTLVRDASVIGTRFTAEMVRALEASDDADRLLHGMDELIARGLVRPSEDADDATGSFVFAHTLARDVAYTGIPKAERARRHARVALWARQGLSWSPGEVDALVAAQAEQAVALAHEMRLPSDDPAWQAQLAGFAALRRLGHAALARDDNARAERLFDRALDIAPDDAQRSDLDDALIGRAAARAAQHRLAEAEDDLTVPLTSRSLRQRSAALVVLGDIRRRRGDEPGAVRALVTGLAAASDAGVDRVVGEALRQLGLVDYRGGRLAAAEGRFREALALAERVGDRRGAGWALQHLAWSATTRGDYALAEQVLRQAADVFASLDDDGGLSWCAGTEAFVRLLQGRLHQARDLAQGLLPLGRAIGDRWGVAACLTIDGFAAAELGAVSVALDETASAYDDFHALADTWGESMALAAKGAALRASGRDHEAVEVLTRSVEISDAAHHPVTGALALTILGYCHLDRGDADGAADAARRALAALSGLDLHPPALVGVRVLLAQALRARHRVDEALPLLREAEVCREASLIFPRRQALAHLAGALLEAGHSGEALATIQDAFAVPAEDVRSRIVALRVLAQCLAAAGDTTAATTAVRQAVALAGATELTSEIPATERALTTLQP